MSIDVNMFVGSAVKGCQDGQVCEEGNPMHQSLCLLHGHLGADPHDSLSFQVSHQVTHCLLPVT